MSPELRVLLCDNHLLAVAKPAGLLTVPDASDDTSLLDEAREWLRREFSKPGRVFVGVVHRLDRPVSGVVLFARTSKAASRLSEAFRTHRVEKRYVAVVRGVPAERRGVLEQWLTKDPGRNRVHVRMPESEGARRAVTRWQVLEESQGRSLLELVPETGRAHQLRVAAATLGCPLLGDLRYGAEEPLEDRSVALHAHSLELRHPARDERVVLRCEPPDRPWWRFDALG